MTVFFGLDHFGILTQDRVEVFPAQKQEQEFAIRWFSSEGEVNPSTIQFLGENEWEHT